MNNRLHLLQQMNEREHMERNKNKARKEYDVDGHPKQAWVLIDAMTNSRGSTPQIGMNHDQSKNETSNQIENRVIGNNV